MSAYPHYFKALPAGCTHIDVYRVLSLFEVSDPALQHAVKKLLCAGSRGAKDQAQDIAEAIATLQRWQQMREEEEQTVPDAAYEKCECGMRDLAECPARFDEPGCGEPAPAAAHENAERGLSPDFRQALQESIETRISEDAERAAYLERWKDAPEWAQWLAEDKDGECGWYGSKPSFGGVLWYPQPASSYCRAGAFMLRSFRCEPRPVPDGGQGVGR